MHLLAGIGSEVDIVRLLPPPILLNASRFTNFLSTEKQKHHVLSVKFSPFFPYTSKRSATTFLVLKE